MMMILYMQCCVWSWLVACTRSPGKKETASRSDQAIRTPDCSFQSTFDSAHVSWTRLLLIKIETLCGWFISPLLNLFLKRHIADALCVISFHCHSSTPTNVCRVYRYGHMNCIQLETTSIVGLGHYFKMQQWSQYCTCKLRHIQIMYI